MSKFPIAWHEECLRNYKTSLKQARIELDNALTRHARLEDECLFLETQLNAAKAKGLTAYDPDKFMKPKAKIKYS